MKAFILAAGLGTRLRPLTDSLPKALVSVNDKPLLQHAIERVKLAGCNEIIINIHHFANQVIEFVNNHKDSGVNLTISDESELLLDTGGAIKQAEWFFKNEKAFLVYNVDILSKINLKELIDAHHKSGAIATLAVSQRESTRYLFFDDNNNLCAWKNVKTDERKIARETGRSEKFAFSGIYMLSSEIFNFMPEEKKFSIIDVFLRAAETNDIKAFIHDSHDILDVGKPDSLKAAESFLK